MSTDNPTRLRIGMTGTLEGWRIRIAARLVMAMEEDGETYYWNEFIVVDGFGRSATLVHEEGDDGPEWKLFKMFEPLRPMLITEAQGKRVGDKVDLHGTPGRVTLVDESRVHFIEGRAPEGVEIGDVAHYFNVDAAGRMLVVSWTGDELEYYSGEKIPWPRVAEAFGLPPTAERSSQLADLRPGGPETFSKRFPTVIAVAMGAMLFFGVIRILWDDRGISSGPPAPPGQRAAPAPKLVNGARGQLGLDKFEVAGHAVLDVARLHARFGRVEYYLRDAAGETALLVNGLNGQAQEWHLLRSVETPRDFTPYDAAARRRGEFIELDGLRAKITALCLSQRKAVEGESVQADWPPGNQYGFVAAGLSELLLARWTESGVRVFRGKLYADSQVLAAFNAAPTAR